MSRNNGADKKDSEAMLAELESQFILRVPSEPAKLLREMIQSGANNLKDRVSVRIENDMRTGEVRLDHMLLHAKVLDLPTIIESLKTIDNKTFYKTADICQVVICKEEEDATTTDDETPTKAKKKDPNKVDKKFLFPHGVTPPMKNVRRRRFRKTLKKKYVEAPEIEKEVKRLLRSDNEAVNVKWEVINEEDDKNKVVGVKDEPSTSSKKTVAPAPRAEAGAQPTVVEQDIFGGAVSDSDEEGNINIMELEDNSRLSADSSRLSDSAPSTSVQRQSSLVTEFSKEMFTPTQRQRTESEQYSFDRSSVFDGLKSEGYDSSKNDEDYSQDSDNLSKDMVRDRITVIEKDLEELRSKRHQQEQEMANIENMALRQRFQDILDNLLTELIQKEQEYNELRHLIQRMN